MFSQAEILFFAGSPAIHRKLDYKFIISKLICDPNNKNCILRLCTECTNKNKFKENLKLLFSSLISSEETFDFEEVITYQEWTPQERSKLIDQVCNYNKLLDSAFKKFYRLLTHHFTSIHQSKYVKNRKKDFDNETSLVFMDFSENFTFVIQNEVQAHYW